MSVIDITIVALILVVGMGLIIFAVRQMNQSKAISERLDQYTDVSLSLSKSWSYSNRSVNGC